MKILSILFLLTLCSVEASAQTYFYKRIKIVRNGQSTNVNDDGHYMTFGNNCIYDSDKDGFCQWNSNMKYIKTEKGIATYCGQSYHGYSYCFVSSDRQRLNIREGNDTHVYIRCSPSSSTVMRQSPSANGGYIVAPITIPSNTRDDNLSVPSNRHDKRKICPACRGTGKGTDQKIYQPDITGKLPDRYCRECGRVGPPHQHHTPMCKTCYGKGYLEF